MQFVEKELVGMRENSNLATSSIVQKKKRLVGRPKKQQNVRLLSEQKIKKKTIENKRPSKCNKKRGGILKLVPITFAATNFSGGEKIWKHQIWFYFFINCLQITRCS